VISEEGYIIVHDGSSYYYLGGDGEFLSGPLNSCCGRAIEGRYEAAAPMHFAATGVMYYFNRPSSFTHYDIQFEINSVERDGAPFDSKNFMFFLRARDGSRRQLPTNPVSHRAYFALERLVPTGTVDAIVWVRGQGNEGPTKLPSVPVTRGTPPADAGVAPVSPVR
jgi:hypothetical protein